MKWLKSRTHQAIRPGLPLLWCIDIFNSSAALNHNLWDWTVSHAETQLQGIGVRLQSPFPVSQVTSSAQGSPDSHMISVQSPLSLTLSPHYSPPLSLSVRGRNRGPNPAGLTPRPNPRLLPTHQGIFPKLAISIRLKSPQLLPHFLFHPTRSSSGTLSTISSLNYSVGEPLHRGAGGGGGGGRRNDGSRCRPGSFPGNPTLILLIPLFLCAGRARLITSCHSRSTGNSQHSPRRD